MEDMRFLDCLGQEWAEDIKNFLAHNKCYTPGMHVEGNGSSWSDFIGCGSSGPGFFVSERVLEDLKEAGVEIMRATEMPIAEIKTKRLQKLIPPRYYVIEALPGVDVDFRASGYPVDAEGNPTSKLRISGVSGLLALRLQSWNGNDLFSTRSGATYGLHCTEKVKDLAEEKGWTNVKFTEVPVV